MAYRAIARRGRRDGNISGAMPASPITALVFVLLAYFWLGYSMLVLRSPMAAMIVYYPVICFGGGILLRRLMARSDPEFFKARRSGSALGATIIFSVIATAGLWASTLLFRPGLIDPGLITSGLESLGMDRQRFWLSAGFLAAVNPFAEEFLWRGSVYACFLARTNRWIAVTLSSLLFAGYHPMVVSMIFSPAWLTVVFAVAFAAGIVFARLYDDTRNLAYPIALHVVINLNLMIIGYLYSPS